MTDAPNETILRITNLTKQYNKKSRGVKDVSLEIYRGEVFGFLGPNGAGKSTTINTILDLLRPTSGSIEIFGQDVRRYGVRTRERIGYLSGDMTTDPSLTGAQYLRFAAKQHGGVEPQKIESLVKRLRCETDKRIKHLSRGNRQKIGLIAALMHDPDLLILDEPTSGLDPLVQEQFNAILKEHKEAGKTTFMSSHVLSEVQANCDRVGFIRDGELIRVSTLDALMEQAPRHVSVVFDTSVAGTELTKLDGVSGLTSSGKRLQFSYHGDYDQLIKWLAKKKLVDIQITEPSLDELFMKYYESNQEVARA